MKKGTNILLALMQLNIGGAETHVVELAKELARRGYNVIVASNGGVYVQELESVGIKHYLVPLQNKKPLNMIKSAYLLKKIIKDEKIDIVHSHARIPSFILGKLHKKMKFPFVTTAHWVFNTGYGLKYITDWGEKTIAVSEDIKSYLMNEYNTPETDITVTVNGIDTEKFSPNISSKDVMEELEIKESDNVVTYVSRLDESRSLVAKQVIEAFPTVDEKVNDLKLIVVGSGDDYENVRTMAEKVNSKLGRRAIMLTGARTDINKLIAPCKLFIGVSRAALEAMAEEKPVIIAGNEGYIGLFDESKLTVGIDTNFCCRDCVESSSELIKADMLKFFGLDENQQNMLGTYGREVIKKYYSVAKMADDSVKAYDWALQKNRPMLISGYYGFGNSGDDALLRSIIDDIRRQKESPNIVVLSANPTATKKQYNVKAVNRLNIFEILHLMKEGEMLISGGGTLIQDRTSTKSLLYYLAVIALAKKHNMKVMMYSNGIGPLNKKSNIKKTQKVLERVDLITLRDDNSLNTLREIGVTNKNAKVTADAALGLDIQGEDVGRKILSAEGVSQNVKLLGVSVRKWTELKPDFEDVVAKVCDYAYEKYGYYTVFLPMQASKDMAISMNIKHKMKHKSTVIEGKYSVNDTLSVISCFDMCIGMRLHTLIYSAINSLPLIGLVYDPKIKNFMEYAHQTNYVDVRNITKEKLTHLLDECVNNYDTIKSDLTENYELLREKARLNGKYAIELYEKGSVEL